MIRKLFGSLAGLVAVLPLGAASVDLSDGLLAYYCFDDESDPGKECSGLTGRNAVLVGDVSSIEGASGKAVYLDGSGDNLTLSVLGNDIEAARDNLSMSFKIYTETGATDYYLMSIGKTSYGDYGFDTYINSSGNVMHNSHNYHDDYFSTFGGSLKDKTWYSLTITYDSGSVNFYKDGVLTVTTDYTTLNRIDNEEECYFGGTDADSGTFKGRVDELRVYSRVLNADEALALHEYNDSQCPEGYVYATNPVDSTCVKFETQCDVPSQWASCTESTYLSDNTAPGSTTECEETDTTSTSVSTTDTCDASGYALSASSISTLSSGWHLLGTSVGVNDMSIFDSASLIWKYDGSWSKFEPTEVGYPPEIDINAFDGFWLKK